MNHGKNGKHEVCPKCKGKGKIWSKPFVRDGKRIIQQQSCPVCRGKGFRVKKRQ